MPVYGYARVSTDRQTLEAQIEQLTGQKPIMTPRQARFQIVDLVATMRPLTKCICVSYEFG